MWLWAPMRSRRVSSRTVMSLLRLMVVILFGFRKSEEREEEKGIWRWRRRVNLGGNMI